MNSRFSILVTGGAGYIGSHTCRLLCDAGHHVVVLDNLYTGHRWAVPEQADFVQGDCGDTAVVAKLQEQHHFDAVIHFAGYVVVPESVSDPVKYYRNNVVTSLNLIEQCQRSGIPRFVFSSSAAVYGMPDILPASEQTVTAPINPYGATKLITEWTLRDVSHAAAINQDANPFAFVALRYFNVAGASLDGSIGQATPNATHLIKVACETAAGKRDSMRVFGNDYNTPDGSCIRDYIHVVDLADAHLRALDYLSGSGSSRILNCGYGHGFSVYQVIDAVKRISGHDFPVVDDGRRAGDPPELISDSHLIRETLDWTPRYDELETICRTAWNWEQKLA